jgi:organic radical activating enzyme
MLIKYESVHGDYFVEVDDNWGELALGDSEVTYNGKQVQISDAKELDALIAEFDRIDSNADRVVRRHGYSLDKIVDDNTSVRLPKGLVSTADTQREAELRDFRERALATLSPENRKLWCQIHILLKFQDVGADCGRDEFRCTLGAAASRPCVGCCG